MSGKATNQESASLEILNHSRERKISQRPLVFTALYVNLGVKSTCPPGAVTMEWD